ncbi:MAG: undecaprenyl-diphosphatase UppP [Bryobacterales bacterium]|nr:undecaprenyl-diphosphatase UppP [Bryobacterales bacterium]MEB2361276.1 undecaprenyl-diphosphatase UppP [Bryobacterales bacterium]
MPLYQVITLAIVQGFTEFLPISSSAHLALAPWLAGWKDQGLTFDIALHFGTLAAVLIYFFRDWLQIAASGFGIDYGDDPGLKQNPRLFWLLVAATIPLGVFGLLTKEYAETVWRTPYVIGTMLILVGMLMLVAERTARLKKDIDRISAVDAMAIGVSQALAVVPGTSRSGITITAGLFRGITRPAAARFSFLLSTPAIAAATLSAFKDLLESGQPIDFMPFIVGMAVSALTGILVIAFFLRFLRVHSLKFFIYYRIVFGIIVIALAAFFRHPAG